MTPEQEILSDIVRRIEQLLVSLDDAFALADPLPRDEAAFAVMDRQQRVASTAALKTVEQVEDQLARLFRVILELLAIDTTGLFAADIAGRMAALGIVEDPAGWTAIVRLRNRLVHDYPLSDRSRLSKLLDAEAAAATMRGIAARAITFVRSKDWL